MARGTGEGTLALAAYKRASERNATHSQPDCPAARNCSSLDAKRKASREQNGTAERTKQADDAGVRTVRLQRPHDAPKSPLPPSHASATHADRLQSTRWPQELQIQGILNGCRSQSALFRATTTTNKKFLTIPVETRAVLSLHEMGRKIFSQSALFRAKKNQT